MVIIYHAFNLIYSLLCYNSLEIHIKHSINQSYGWFKGPRLIWHLQIIRIKYVVKKYFNYFQSSSNSNHKLEYTVASQVKPQKHDTLNRIKSIYNFKIYWQCSINRLELYKPKFTIFIIVLVRYKWFNTWRNYTI